MRNAFAEEITSLASENDQIVLLSGDIGNRLFNKFKDRMPERFYNCGVAEANMIGIASGMALSGLRPIAYTITPFITARCYEQIKVDVSYHNVPVLIVGTGSGLSYAELGGTHHSCDDISLMRGLPNMTVICPADVFEVKQALRAALKHRGPVYIRIGKKGEPIIHKQEPNFVIGKGIVIQNGRDICLLSTGSLLPMAMEAGENLGKQNISTQIVSFHTIKPLDQELLADVFSKFKVVVAMEEHNLIGGFSSSLAEWLADQNELPRKGKLIRIGISDRFFCEAGKQIHARRYFGLTSEKIAARVLKILNRR